MPAVIAIGFTVVLIASVALISEMLVGNFSKIVATLSGESVGGLAASASRPAQVTALRSFRGAARASANSQQADWLLAA